MTRQLLCFILLSFLLPLHAAEDPWRTKARAIYADLVAMPSVDGKAGAQAVADYLAGVFRGAGFAEADVKVLPYAGTAAFMARLPARGRATARPILLIAHMDVVDALASDWSRPPFELVEEGGYFYGRGTSDNKGGLVAQVIALLRLHAEGFATNRDLVIFFTGDEETGGIGAGKMAGEWRAMHNAEFALNSDDITGRFLADGTSLGFGIQTSEKTYASYSITARNRGGHSSFPRPDNAIYALAGALQRLAQYRFPPMANETTRAYLRANAARYPGAAGAAMRAFAANPADTAAADTIEKEESLVGKTRTTCVATLLSGGHAENALPQTASATVNCRIFPGVTKGQVHEKLSELAGQDLEVALLPGENPETQPSLLREDVTGAFTAAVHARFPGADIIPYMSNGATDGAYLRAAGIPTYLVNGSWHVVPEDERDHGRDERLPVEAFYGNLDHWYAMLRHLTGNVP